MPIRTPLSAARQFLLQQLGLESGVFVEKRDARWNDCAVFSYRTEIKLSGHPNLVAVDGNLQARFMTEEEERIFRLTCHNPYAVVREETVEDVMEENGVRRVKTIGYDMKGRVVDETIKRYYPDGREGHSSRIVNADGYWYGGFSDYLPDGTPSGGQFPLEKFDENAKEN